MSRSTDEIPLLVEVKDGVVTLTMNRPRALNALSHDLIGQLLNALKKAERDASVRCVVLAAAGRAFSSGADLLDLKKMYDSGEVSLGSEVRQYYNPLIRQIRGMEKPVVAAIQGTAAGAGVGLALACDIKIAAESVKFVSAFISVGLAPDSGFSFWFARALGLGRALEYAWMGKPLSALDARSAGLLNRVVPDADLAAAVKEAVDALVKAPPRAVALTKRLMNRALSNDFDAQLEYELQIQDILGNTKDHREGVAAFLERRPPAFKGE